MSADTERCEVRPAKQAQELYVTASSSGTDVKMGSDYSEDAKRLSATQPSPSIGAVDVQASGAYRLYRKRFVGLIVLVRFCEFECGHFSDRIDLDSLKHRWGPPCPMVWPNRG